MNSSNVTKVDFNDIILDSDVLLNVREDGSGNGLHEMDDLVSSIKEVGLLQPLSVLDVRAGNEHTLVLVAGFRRYHAIKKIREEDESLFEKVEVKKFYGDATTAQVINLIENLQRQDLKPHQVCKGIYNLSQKKLSQAEIAKQIGKTQGFVSQMLKIYNGLSSEAWLLFKRGELTVSGALELVNVSEEEQDKVVEEIKEVEETEMPKQEKKEAKNKAIDNATGRIRYVVTPGGCNQIYEAIKVHGIKSQTEEYTCGALDILAWILGHQDLPFEIEV